MIETTSVRIHDSASIRKANSRWIDGTHGTTSISGAPPMMRVADANAQIAVTAGGTARIQNARAPILRTIHGARRATARWAQIRAIMTWASAGSGLTDR